MGSYPDLIKRSGFEPWPGTLCCVLVTGELNTGGGGGVTLRWTSIPSRGRAEILLIALCY